MRFTVEGLSVSRLRTTLREARKCKSSILLLAHPIIYIGQECEKLTNGHANPMNNIKGLVKTKALPPRNLYIPLSPVRMHNRLIFALCRSCCEEGQEESCNHENVEERCFTGTWVGLELEKAVQLGYKILEMYIVWDCRTTQYDIKTKKGGFLQDISIYF